MRNIFYSFLIFFFIITIFSCGKTTEENVNDAVSTTNENIEGIIEDNNDTVATDSTTNSSWTKQLGSSGHEFGLGVTTDSSDNIYVSGNTWGGLGGKKHEGKSDIFLIKFNSSGTKKWIRQFGTSGDDKGSYKGVTTDSSDNIYVTGWTQGGLDGNTNSGYEDIILIKYNSSGTKQ